MAKESPASAVTTITDVARRANVSAATVSRVLNGTTGVTADRAERVRRAVAELGYTPFSPARAMRRGATDVWAVIIPDIENPFFTSVVRGIEDEARSRGFRVVLCNSDEDTTKESDYIDVAIAERMGGVIIAVASARRSSLDALLARNIGVVAIDRRPTGVLIDSVTVDNREGAAQAVSHLLSAGARRIGLVTGPARVPTANDRLAGYKDALAAAGVRFDADLVVREDFRPVGGYKATSALCGRRRRPDALFVANNVMTLGALQALRDLGLRVPDDIAVVGWDDGPWAPLLDPPLTVVAQPTEQIGRLAAELLATTGERGAGAGVRRIVLPSTLVVRGSSTRT